MNRRRALAALAAWTFLPMIAQAQRPNRIPVIGVLVTHPPLTDTIFDNLRTGLRTFGYVDGKNIKIEARTALGRLERVPALAQELIELQPAAVLVVNEIAARALINATDRVPIVLAGVAARNPIDLQLIESYARPGGNVTGIFSADAVLVSKRLEMLRDLAPAISRVAVFWDSNFGQHQLGQLEAAARSLRFELHAFDVTSTNALEPAFRYAVNARAEALFMTFSPVFWINRSRIAQLALEAKLPSVSEYAQYVEGGGLLSYGSFVPENWERAAYYVDRLLKGAKVADLPVEQLSTFRLTLNVKTARALGIKIPESILLRADEVIR